MTEQIINPYFFTSEDKHILRDLEQVVKVKGTKRENKVRDFVEKYGNIVDHINDLYELVLKDDAVFNQYVDHVEIKSKFISLIFVRTAPFQRYCFFIPTTELNPILPDTVSKSGNYFLQGNVVLSLTEVRDDDENGFLFEKRVFTLGNHKIKIESSDGFIHKTYGLLIFFKDSTVRITLSHEQHGIITYTVRFTKSFYANIAVRNDRHR